MQWTQTVIDKVEDVLRMILRSFIFLILFFLGAFGVWFVACFLWQLLKFLSRTLFHGDW